jgi:hypothetical protein
MRNWKSERNDLRAGAAEEKAHKGTPRLLLACALDRLVAFNRGGFSFDGHRLSSLYRDTIMRQDWLMDRFFTVFSLRKYSSSTSTGCILPGIERHR